MVLSHEISEETAAFLEAYSLPAGVINGEGRWLFKNSTLREQLDRLDHEGFFALLKDKEQEKTIKKRIKRNKRIQLVEAKLVSGMANMMVCSARVRIAGSSQPLYLLEFHPRRLHLHAFASLNRLYQEQAKHDKMALTADIELQRAMSESRRDPLTGIANRRGLEEQLLLAWEQAYQRRSRFSFLMLDLDFFKQINDLYGHSQGDKVLVQVARTLTENVNRKDDAVARFGGEEFSVLLPDTDISGAKCVANKLLVAVRALQIPNAGSDVADRLTVSVGGYTVKPLQVEADLYSVIRYADLALYRAKQQGRNRAVHHGFSYG